MSESLPVRVVGVSPFSGLVAAVCNVADIDPEAILPISATIVARGEKRSVWLYDQTQFPEFLRANAAVVGENIAMARTVTQKAFGTSELVDAYLELPPHTRLAVWASAVDDLPPGNTVQISTSDAAKLGLSSSSTRVLLTTSHGTLVSAEAQTRSHVAVGCVRMSMLLRTLLQVTRETVVMASIGHPVLRTTVQQGRWRHFVRRVDRSFESFLVHLFRAPVVTLHVAQLSPSDDDSEDVIRIDPSSMTALGIQAGDQVLVDWQGHQSAARALPSSPREAATADLTDFQRVDRRPDISQQLVAGMVVNVSAIMRRDLGLPVSAVVTIRRRVRTVAQGKMNQLTLPLLGLLLAAAALQDFPFWALFTGAALIGVLGLANIRIPKPPRGLY